MGTRYISRFELVPGCAGSNRTYSQYSRPNKILLQGRNRTVAIQVNDHRNLQQFEFDPPLPAEELTIRVESAYQGRNSAICFSELRFHEQNIFAGVTENTRKAIESHASALINADGDRHMRALIQLGSVAVPRLLMGLDHPSIEVQRRSLQALKTIGSPRAAAALLRYHKKGPQPELLPITMQAIARTGDARAVAIFAKALAGDDNELADVAGEAIKDFGSNVLAAVEPLLKHSDDVVVGRALRALSFSREERAVELAAPYASSLRASLRIAAAEALSGKTSPIALELIEKLSTDEIISVRLSVVKSLSQLTNAKHSKLLESMLNDRDYEVAENALNALATREAGIGAIARYLNNPVAPLGNQAVQKLTASGDDAALNIMIEALRRGESRFRVALRRGIAEFGPAGVRALLKAAMNDKWLRSDCEIVMAGHPSIATPLISEMIERDPTSIPPFLIRALNAGSGSQAIVALDKAFASGSTQIQSEVIRAWSRFPAAVVADRLMNVLKNSNHSLRARAVVAVGKAQVKKATATLLELLNDNTFPAELAIEALGRLQVSEAGSIIVSRFKHAPLNIRFAILRACKNIQSTECLKLLYNATDDYNHDLRDEALKLLAIK